MTPSRRNLLTGIIIGIFIAGVLFYFRSTISEQGPPFLIGFLTCLALLGILLIIGGIWFQKQIYERFFGETPKEADVNQSLENTVGSFAKRYLPETTDQDVKSGVKLIQSFMWGRTVYTFIGVIISIFLVLGGLIGSVLLFKQNDLLGKQNALFIEQNSLITTQNEKLDSQISLLSHQNSSVDQQTELLDAQTDLFSRQNDLVTDQNLKIDVQTGLFRSQNRLFNRQNEMIDTQNYRLNLQNNLIEADRRSSLVFLMSNILDKVDDEIKEQRDSIKMKLGAVPDSTKFALSKPLISRIVALSRAFKPYRILEGDSLSKLVSPERGQLFISLLENELDSLTQNTIVTEGDFSYANIGEINLDGANLVGCNLYNANIIRSSFKKANVRWANFREANLYNNNFVEADLYWTLFSSANLSGSDFTNANLSNAQLDSANLYIAILDGANLRRANLTNAWLLSAYFHNADLRHANLKHAHLGGAFIIDADLSESDLSGGDLGWAVLEGSNFEGVEFNQIRNLTKRQLLDVISLYNCKNLPRELEAALKKEKPCLFTKEGCK